MLLIKNTAGMKKCLREEVVNNIEKSILRVVASRKKSKRLYPAKLFKILKEYDIEELERAVENLIGLGELKVGMNGEFKIK